MHDKRDLLRRLGRHELGVVLSVGVVALGSWVFAAVLDEVQEGEARGVDRALLLALRDPTNVADPVGPLWLEQMARDITALGSTTVLSVLILFAVGYLVLLRKPKGAAFVAGAMIGAMLLSLVLKQVVARPRPDLLPMPSHVITHSFPSGHAMMSTAVYLTLGALLARLHGSLALKAYMLLWALSLAFLIGVSRVYVGVHWPTDVIAGWAAGGAWASMCWILARALQRRGSVERDLTQADNSPG